VPAGALILASRSPQRRAILDQLGIPFEGVASDIVELVEGPPGEVAAENAYRKAAAAAGLAGGGVAAEAGATAADAGGRLVLGVDTIVTLGGRIYGKPVDAEDARRTLRALGGLSHAVLSGICLIEPRRGRVRTAVSTTIVEFRALDERLIDWYLATGEWTGRAGGYAIQGRGASLVRSIDGDYLNVVGLPVSTLLELAPEVLWAP
jgi:septum formation protein